MFLCKPFLIFISILSDYLHIHMFFVTMYWICGMQINWNWNQQPTITGVDLCHKNVGRPWFTETRVIPYQPFVLVHNNRFHSECYTNDKGCNKTCENNIPPMDIQYLKIHVRNWIRPQTSQWYTNKMKWTRGDKPQPTAVRRVQHHFTSMITQLWLPNS
jgi:hypothetical protein